MADIRPLIPFPITKLLILVNRRSYARLHEIVSGKTRCPAELAIAIEEATGGAVRRGDLRPDLWPPNHDGPTDLAA